MTNEQGKKLESTILHIMQIEVENGQVDIRPQKITRADTVKIIIGSVLGTLACGVIKEATLPDGTGIPTVVPTSGPEKEPQPIKYATWVEIGMDEQAKFTDSLPADRPRFLKGGSSELAGFRLDNGVQDPIVTKFIMYEINPDDSFEIVDAQGNRANQNAVIYIQEYDGYGNVKLKKLYGVSYATIDTNTGKTVGTSTIWSEVADSKIDTANKTVDLTGAKPVLIINSDQSDTKMYFRPLMPKNMLVGLPSNIDEVALPVMFPGSAFKMVGVEATAQPEVAKLPDTLDQMYKDQIEKFGYKWKYDKDGNILVNFGDYNSYFEDKTAEDQFVLAFTKTEGGYKTNAFIHNADMISTTDTEGFADSLKERGRGGENVFKTQSDGTFGFIAMSTGAIIEKTVQTKENGEAKVIEAVFVCVDKDDALTYQSAITSVCYTDGAYKVLVGYGMNPKTPQTPQEASEYLTQGKVLELFIDHKGNKNFDPRSSFYRYITDFTLGFVPVAKEMLSTKEFPVSNTSIPTFTMGNI